MGLFPKIDVPAITAELNVRFQELVGELRALGGKLDEILQELKKETK